MAVATATFTGFRPEAIQFLVDLQANNDRAWFQPRKADYERLLKEPLEALCAALDEEFRVRKLPLRADPGRSPFRIYRDVRFSKDKSPYKTHVAASFGWAGDEQAGGEDDHSGRSHRDDVHGSGGYFHLQPGEIYVGGGVWHPETSWLTAFRQGLISDYDRFRSIVEEPRFRKTFGTVGDDGESLKRVPPGYPADHHAADLLRLKNVTFGRRLADRDATSPNLPVVIAESFEIGTPLMRYLSAVG
jgi:uncharacterized protein (TIGR02453 family)